MFARKLFKQIPSLISSKEYTSINRSFSRFPKHNQANKTKDVTVHRSFEEAENKTKETYLDLVRIFINRDHVHRRGHVEFIYAALKNMEGFGVNKELEVYKALIDVLPKGKFIPENIFQSEFMHYPKQQQCAIDLLEQMEDNGVMPDYEMEDMLMNVFGSRGYPLRKFWRMMYWMPKFKNLSPWPLPDPIPKDIFELAKLAITRITTVDPQSKVTIYETAHIQDSIDETWIVSAQSPTQKQLLKKHDIREPIYVEGAFRIWIKDKPVDYFMMRANVKKKSDIDIVDTDDVSNLQFSSVNFSLPNVKRQVVTSTVHEQNDGVIFSLCASGTSSKDSLLSWVRHLELDGNPSLADIPIVFTLKSGTREVTTTTGSDQKELKEEK